MDRINVLYCFDSESWRAAAVSVESLLLNANDTTRVNVYCMVAPKTKGYRKIKKIVKSHISGANLIWREIKPNEISFYSPEFTQWNPVTFYRCFAHRFFKDIDKIVYLSTDTLIYHDLSELFYTDVSDCVFAAVRDMAPINEANNPLGASVREFAATYLNNGPYFNAGVLVLNLRKMSAYEYLLFNTKVPLRYPAQDLLNAAFVGKIRMLPLKYNLAPGIGVPSHFSPEESNEVNAGRHIIIDCYYAKPYNKATTNDVVYNMFEKCSKKIGMKPEKFLKDLLKAEPIRKTFIPFVKVRGQTVLFFGKEIE